MEPIGRRQEAANLRQDFTPQTLLPIVGDDEPLVRSYLEHFLLDAKDYKIFAPYVNDQYLKRSLRRNENHRPASAMPSSFIPCSRRRNISSSRSASISNSPTRTRPSSRPTSRWRWICMSRMSTR